MVMILKDNPPQKNIYLLLSIIYVEIARYFQRKAGRAPEKVW
jgi:hypothetical protein